VLFLGHGALIRRAAWEAVGGFPEIATEDLAFSMALAAKGMQGIFLEHLICREDFAENYEAFKRQQERYLVGTTEVVRKYLGSMLRSSKTSLTEKVDSVMWCLLLYLPALVLLFVLLSAIGIASVFGHWQTPMLTVKGHEFALPAIRTIREPFGVLASPGFQLFSVVCVLAPTLPAMALGLRKRLNFIRLIALNTAPYFSLMVVAWTGMLRYLFTGRVTWGSVTSSDIWAKPPSEETSNLWRPSILLEVGVGLLLCVASLAAFNLALFAVSSCLLIGVGMQVFGWENSFVRTASVACFALIILQLLISLASPFQSQIATPFPFPIHL
jgi:hypothetical protein